MQQLCMFTISFPSREVFSFFPFSRHPRLSKIEISRPVINQSSVTVDSKLCVLQSSLTVSPRYVQEFPGHLPPPPPPPRPLELQRKIHLQR